MKSLIFVLVLFVSTSVFASMTIVSVRGACDFIRDATTQELKTSTELKTGDIIKTSEKSFVKLQLHESLITIAPNSYYKVSNEKSDDEQSELGTLIYGHLHAYFKKNDKNKRVIKTPTASMGVRGTKILLHVARDASEYRERYKGKIHPAPTMDELTTLMNSDKAFSQICCITGKISVKTEGGTQKMLAAGDVLNYTATGKKTKSVKYNTKTLEGTAKRFGF